MTECAQCGDCCTRFPLNTPERADIWGRKMLAAVGRWGPKWHFTGADRKLWAWMSNLVVVGGPWRATWTDKDGNERAEWRWYYRCPIFDEKTRLCGDHTNRPDLCRRYPWYDREPQPGSASTLSPRCSFVGDDPSVKMLPIVEVKGGHSHREPEAVRDSAA